MRRLSAGLACFVALVALSACAGQDRRAPQAANRPTVTTVAAESKAAPVKQRSAHLSGRNLDLAVYYLRSFKGRRYLAPEWHPVPYTRAVAAAAAGELLGGQPLCPGSRRPFPAGARLRGVTVDGDTATVDLSGSALRVPAGRAERWRLQALVYTLTQFPTVRRVLVRVKGQAVARPLARDPALPLAPIALAEPTPGTQVTGHRLVVKGEASVHEGTVGLRLRDDHGQTMAQAYATAAQGAPRRGSFSGALTFTPPATSHSWTLEAFEVSPKSGRIVYAIQVKVWVGR
jgi:hypothetical protein